MGIKKQLFITAAIFTLLFLALYGRKVPVDKDVYRRIGYFTVRPYKYGLYLTQEPNGVFYNFSPYDFMVETADKKTNLVFEGYSSESSYRYKNHSVQTKAASLLSYFGLTNPSATFITESGKVTLASERKNNEVDIYLKNIPHDFEESGFITMTMSVNPSDLIFDEKRTLYTNTPLYSDIAAIHRLSPAEPVADTYDVTLKKYLFIANPKTSGVIQVEIDPKKFFNVVVNLKEEQIQFRASMENPSIHMKLLDSMEEVRIK